MPGPFPGMDPYLETASTWQGTHNALITLMRGALNAVLPAPYVASTEVRCYIERPSETYRSDVFVRRSEPREPRERSGVAVLEDFTAAVEFEVYPAEHQEAYLNIFSVADRQRVVTTIELLSPTNKTSRDAGRKLYLEKQRVILKSHTHLIEIDPLRAGRHTVAIPKSAFLPEHRYDYLVCLHRAGTEGRFLVWLNTLRERLPVIRVPLEGDLPDVSLDLQAVFDRNYDEGAYASQIDYTQEPNPPLTGDDAVWTEALLREKGL